VEGTVCGKCTTDFAQGRNLDETISRVTELERLLGLKTLELEIANHKIATIACGRDGQPALLEHGRTGWIMPSCDVEELSRALLHLASI